MTCSATLRHNAGEALAGVDRKTSCSKRLERGRPGLRALRRGGAEHERVRARKSARLLLARAARRGRGRARRKPRLGRRPRRPSPIAGGGVRLLSPEAPPSFGAIGDVSPLIAVFNAARAAQDDALSLMPFAEPKFDVSAGGDRARRRSRQPKVPAAPGAALPRRPAPAPSANRPAPRDSPPPIAEPPAAPPLSPDADRAPGGDGAARRRAPISRTRSAPATGAPPARRSRSSTPRATTSRYGSARTA